MKHLAQSWCMVCVYQVLPTKLSLRISLLSALKAVSKLALGPSRLNKSYKNLPHTPVPIKDQLRRKPKTCNELVSAFLSRLVSCNNLLFACGLSTSTHSGLLGTCVYYSFTVTSSLLLLMLCVFFPLLCAQWPQIVLETQLSYFFSRAHMCPQ